MKSEGRLARCTLKGTIGDALLDSLIQAITQLEHRTDTAPTA